MERLYSTERVAWPQVSALFAEVGWGARDPAQVQAAFEKSSHVIFIYDEGELIGVGRTVDDGCYYGMLVDVAVKPGRQQGGIGREVVTHLRAKLEGYRFITLTAATGKDEFYLKLGWLRQSSAMIWPVSEEQREFHAR